MPYKIVQTIENGKALLTAVPSQWEKEGVLQWPKKKFEKLRKNEESLPNEKWIMMNCIVKRTNLTLQEAEDEINDMCKNSDTESCENVASKKRKRQTTTHNEILSHNFNNLAETCVSLPIFSPKGMLLVSYPCLGTRATFCTQTTFTLFNRPLFFFTVYIVLISLLFVLDGKCCLH